VAECTSLCSGRVTGGVESLIGVPAVMTHASTAIPHTGSIQDLCASP
jgi:cystathionine beta-lyase/cystathionine gamma-synthase